MKHSEFFSIGLPKWPAMVVVGKPVTREQAMEIIIRTDCMSFSSNDSQFDAQLNEFFFDIKITNPRYGGADDAIREKLKLNKDQWTELWEYKDQVRKGVGHIPLEYLTNSQIVSSWIGGPHGWCDWNGNIGTRNYNIGKWPSVEEVFKEWKAIAKEFPFLDLRCQLMDHEVDCSEDGMDHPIIEFVVKNGRVQMKKPKGPLSMTIGLDEKDFAKVFARGGERGCTIETFKKAVDFVRNKQKK